MHIDKILVIGGTGMLGFPVAKQLKKDGYFVDILTTNKSSAVARLGGNNNYIEGDVKSIDVLRKIFSENNYDGVHINLSSLNYKELQEIEVQGTKNIIKVAKESEFEKVTMISGMGVQNKNAWSRFIKAKIEIEKIVLNSGIKYTIFNCTHFMESLSKYVRNGQMSLIGKEPHPVHWIAANDYAEMVSKAFANEESNGKIISVLGPEPITMKEAFQKYIQIIDPSLKYKEVPLGAIKMMALLTFNKSLKYVADLMDYFEKVPENPAEGTITDILGRPSTTLETWLKSKKND